MALASEDNPFAVWDQGDSAIFDWEDLVMWREEMLLRAAQTDDIGQLEHLLEHHGYLDEAILEVLQQVDIPELENIYFVSPAQLDGWAWCNEDFAKKGEEQLFPKPKYYHGAISVSTEAFNIVSDDRDEGAEEFRTARKWHLSPKERLAHFLFLEDRDEEGE